MSDNQPTGGQVTANASVETISSLGNGRTHAGGSVGQRLLSNNFDINCLRPCAEATSDGLSVNGVLLDEEWKYFDRTIQQVARERLPAVTELIQRGLVMNLPNAMGVMTLEWERIKGDLVDAEVTMSGLPEATKDRDEFEIVSMPIPIFHKEFYYNLRHMQAARRNGRNLDVTHAEVATRKISELIETVLFNGLNVGGQSIYGLRSEPNRKSFNLGTSWITASGEQIVQDVIAMIDLASSNPNNFEGPFNLYISQGVAARFGDDYKANSDKTVMQRVMEIPGIQSIQMTSRVASGEALLVQTTSDVIEMINGLEPTMVEWDSHGGFQHNFKIFAIMVPRVRSTGWQQSGIVHAA